MNVAPKKLFKCSQCHALFEVLTECECPDGKLHCNEFVCNEVIAGSVDASKEKHVPVIEQSGTGIRVAVGSDPHPMTPEHYIMWIEVSDGSMMMRKYLRPGEAPEAYFEMPYKRGLTAREYCNLHNLWINRVE